tara:strand:- start:396 stop:578 length:183 start_codon:yes stop_codon:yes gene_type:complete
MKEMSEKTYTISVTYTAEVTTSLPKDEVEEGIWVGGLEIALLNDGTSVTADADDYQIEEE